MKIPKKIDDRIKNAIVNIQFVSAIPSSALIGLFFAHFEGKVKINNLPSSIKSLDNMLVEEETFFLTLDERIRIQIGNNSIIFNITNEYIGWEDSESAIGYRSILREFLNYFLENSVISGITRIGIRYISLFDSLSIYPHINGSITLNFIEGDTIGNARFEYKKEGFTIVLNLLNNQLFFSESSTPKTASIVDIDVIKIYETISEKSVLLDTLDTAHRIEKEIFFVLLNEDFIQTLNPRY